MIRVIGLGNRDGEMSLRGAVAISDADVVIVKTALTDTYKFFEDEGIKAITLDHLYEISSDFDELNRRIVKEVLGYKALNVAFCVNGSGVADRSVIALMQSGEKIEIIAGVSRESEVLSSNPSVSYMRITSYDITGDKVFSYDKTKPLVITDIDNMFIASEVKEVLSRLVGAEQLITFVDNDGREEMEVFELDRLENYDYSSSILVPPLDITTQKAYSYDDLIRIMYRLRAKDGCEWDKVQTHESIRKNAIEEAYELVNAIENQDIDNIIEESGDVILQGVFHAVIGEDEGEFEAHEVISHLCYKLISRHRHIFGGEKASTPEEALAIWEKAKADEKGNDTVSSKLLSIAEGLPSVMRAEKVQKLASKMGFEFSSVEQIIAKINEEIGEFIGAKVEDKEMEAGDVLFAVINLLRYQGVEAEVALNRSTTKFMSRVVYVDSVAKERNIDTNNMSDDIFHSLWSEAKANEDK